MHGETKHAPAPSQAKPPVHSPFGSVLIGTREHRPCDPCRLHATHAPVHALLQQNPSTQRLVAHSRARVQVLLAFAGFRGRQP